MSSHFQVYYPLRSGTSLTDLKAIMPVSWELQESEIRDRFNIISALDATKAGHLIVLPKAALISVDETTIPGVSFWSIFSSIHSWLNPYDTRFGVLYLPGGVGEVYELDDAPDHLSVENPAEEGGMSEEARKYLSHYDEATAWYVSFRFGDWHNQDSIKLQSRKRILKDGLLGPDEGPVELALGKIENEKTM